MGHAIPHFLPHHLGPGEGLRDQILLNFNYKVKFKEFKLNFVCLLTNERYKTYQMGLLFRRLGHVPGVGPVGTVGDWGCIFFSEIQPDLRVSYLHD